jgi:hypothetical protein
MKKLACANRQRLLLSAMRARKNGRCTDPRLGALALGNQGRRVSAPFHATPIVVQFGLSSRARRRMPKLRTATTNVGSPRLVALYASRFVPDAGSSDWPVVGALVRSKKPSCRVFAYLRGPFPSQAWVEGRAPSQ